MKSPYEVRDSLELLRFKTEADASLSNSTGDYESQTITAAVLAALRKGFVTAYAELSYYRQKVKSGPNETMMYTFSFHPHLNWDFLPYLYAEGGLVWEKNPLHMMENQYLPYAGVGTKWSISPEHQLNIFAAGGRAFPSYAMPVSFFGMRDGAYNGLYASEFYRFVMSSTLALEQTFVHTRNLDETKRYSSVFSLKLSASMFRAVSLTLGYTYNLSTEAGFFGASEVDTGQNAGIQIIL